MARVFIYLQTQLDERQYEYIVFDSNKYVVRRRRVSCQVLNLYSRNRRLQEGDTRFLVSSLLV